MKKKMCVLSALLAAGSVLVSFSACSYDTGGSSGGASLSSGESSSGSSALSTITSSSAVAKGAIYTESITIDLSNSPLSEAGVSALKMDSSQLAVTASTLTASSSSRAAVPAARSASSSEGSLDNYVVIESISTTKIVFKFNNYKAPSEDGVVIVSVEIPAELTKKNEAITEAVKVLKVGDGMGSMSTAAATLTIPADSEMAGKVLKRTMNNGTEWYVDFANKKFYEVNNLFGWSRINNGTIKEEYVYNFTYSNGTLSITKNEGEKYELAVRKDSSGNIYLGHLYKRVLGTGSNLFSSFSWTAMYLAIDDNDVVQDWGTVVEEIVTFTSDAVFQATVRASPTNNFPAEVISELKSDEEYDEIFGTHFGLAGFYKNDAGFISGYGAEAISSGKSMTGTLAGQWIYDGNNVFWCEKASQMSASNLPKIVPN